MRLYIQGFDMNKTNNMSIRTYSLPIIPFLETLGEWETVVSQDSDPEFSFSLRPVKFTEQDGMKSWSREPLNQQPAFEIREAFFAVRETSQALAFFQTFGPWQMGVHLGTQARTIRFSAVLRQRNFYEDALLTREIMSVRKSSTNSELRASLEDLYLWSNLPMEMVFRQPPAIICRCKDIVDSLRATVFLDRLDGSPWRRCAREDCGHVFKLTSKRARLYCSTDCAHLQSVRGYNSRKAARAKTGAGKGMV